jgi:hypothetical protein
MKIHQYCAMKVKSQQGLSKHQRTSKRCIWLQRSLESKGNKIQDSKPSALKPGPTAKRKGVLDQEHSKPAAKRTVVLDNVTMQKLALSASSDKALLETLAKQALRNPVHYHIQGHITRNRVHYLACTMIHRLIRELQWMRKRDCWMIKKNRIVRKETKPKRVGT